jgi:hypothetical protein
MQFVVLNSLSSKFHHEADPGRDEEILLPVADGSQIGPIILTGQRTEVSKER